MYVTSDVLMCTSSILHLCTISLERYLAIRSPLSLRNKSKGVVVTKIVLVWILSSAITSPITILGFVDERNVLNNHQCALTNDEFIIYGSIGAFFIPLAIMVTAYGLTIRLLRQQAIRCGQGQDNEGQPMIRRSTSRKQVDKFRKRVKFEPRRTQSCPHKKCNEYSGYCNLNRSIKSCGNGTMETDIPDIEISPPSSPLYTNKRNIEPDLEENHNGVSWRKPSLTSTTCSSLSNDSPKRLRNLVIKHQSALRAASILLMKKDRDNIQEHNPQHSPRHDQDNVNTEQRASKVLGVVFAIFVICWAPFFIVNIMTVICKECEFQPLLFTAFVWLGYISSTLNPIIYTMFNKTFKLTFIKLLKCQYKTIQKSLRVRWHSRNGYQSTFRTHAYYTSDNKAESKL